MTIIGITGLTGVGKNYIADTLFPNAIKVDVDKIGYAALDNPDVLCAVKSELGDFDRKELGDILFCNRRKYHKFVEIVWPKMESLIQERFDSHKIEQDLVINWLLLPKTKFWDMCDIKILIERPDGARRFSLYDRDQIGDKRINQRDDHSPNFSEYTYTFVIQNKHTTSPLL